MSKKQHCKTYSKSILMKLVQQNQSNSELMTNHSSPMRSNQLIGGESESTGKMGNHRNTQRSTEYM